MTVDKDFADRIVAGGGWSIPPEDPGNPPPDDLPVTRIVEYDNAWGTKGYGCTFRGDDQDKYMTPTAYILNPKIYWERERVH